MNNPALPLRISFFMFRQILTLTAVLAAACPAWAEEPLVALVGATVHPVSGSAIPDGVVVIRGERIEAVGPGDLVPESAERIDLTGKHVYPSLIAAYTQLGLVEIESVRATRDASETGAINPNVVSHAAFNPDSELLPVTRSNGVLMALVAPTGGRVSGCSSVLRLAGWTWEQMLVEPRVGLHINWPSERPRRDGDDDSQPAGDPLESLTELFDDAQRYLAEREASEGLRPIDLRLESMAPVLAGERAVIVSANSQSQIESAVSFCVGRGLRMILHGGYDAPRCAALLKEHDIPVIVRGVYNMPRRRHEPYDHAFTLPARLHEAGVAFCIAGSGNAESWNARNLPNHAAMAAAFGLPRDVALRAITLGPAQILGVDDRVGSLEAGKHATLIVTDGDPLKTATHVERAFVLGEEIDLNDRHKRLYKKFRARLTDNR